MRHLPSKPLLIIFAVNIAAAVLWFSLSYQSHAAGNTYYVATNGSDSNSGTDSSPFRTIAIGLTRLSAGDTLYLRGGTYAESIRSSKQTIPSGSSWSNAVTIASYPGETATLKPNDGNPVALTDANIQYVIFDGLIFDAVQESGEAIYIWNGPHYIRFQNGEVKNAPISGIQGTSGGTSPEPHHIEFINLKVHDNGNSRLDHGFYIGVQDMLVDGCEMYDNSGYGLQVYEGYGTRTDNSIFRNNKIHDNHGDGGVTLNHGNNMQFYTRLWPFSPKPDSRKMAAR